MLSRPFRAALNGGLLALAACTEPDAGPVSPGSGPPPVTVSPETARLEGIARRFALALGDSTFRAGVQRRLVASPHPEGKFHLQRSLRAGGGAALREVARLNGEEVTRLDEVARLTQDLEVYLPVPGHRRLWQGGSQLLVATAARDGDLPVAFDLKGGRHLLDPTRPPRTPVLAVVPVESDYDAFGVSTHVTCLPPEPCGGGGGSALPLGLYMTQARFVEEFESWLKGSPEFEIHVMGQKGTTDSLTKYQCADEHRAWPYNWDGGTSWSGNVLLFSQAEIDAYHVTHPGEAFRIVAMEDDDTACEMRIDPDRWRTFVGTIGPLYQDFTGAIDSGSVKKYVAAGRSLRKFIAKLAALIKTNDDLIGNAMEDKVVNEYRAGYNWILRADNNKTNGWLKLEMK